MTRRDEAGQIPCQVGTLAQLRRVDPAHAGRIVPVPGPATTTRVPGKAFQLLAWQVSVMSGDLELDYRMTSDFIVPRSTPPQLIDVRQGATCGRSQQVVQAFQTEMPGT